MSVLLGNTTSEGKSNLSRHATSGPGMPEPSRRSGIETSSRCAYLAAAEAFKRRVPALVCCQRIELFLRLRRVLPPAPRTASSAATAALGTNRAVMWAQPIAQWCAPNSVNRLALGGRLCNLDHAAHERRVRWLSRRVLGRLGAADNVVAKVDETQHHSGVCHAARGP